MDDYQKYVELADNLDYRKDLEFAMYGAKNFGIKALPLLCTSDVFGNDYRKIVKEACDCSIKNGEHQGLTSSVCKEFLKQNGCSTTDAFFDLEKMAYRCDLERRQHDAEKLSKRIQTATTRKSPEQLEIERRQSKSLELQTRMIVGRNMSI
ncbi:hypothetical protein ACSFBI_05355 [Variovorax sp. RB3P1]|uniref:hypothetical protein n=1 Tax=Variovorax sp. RB3P1 TaxID=3443732 RepID=UPI003F4533D8